MTRYRLDLAYDGGPFRGFAINKDVPTVGGVLRSALEQVFQHDVPIVCAGRTDAGVHALGQVVCFDTDKPVHAEKLRTSLNQLCKPHIVVNHVEPVPDEFDARFSCTSRSYRYRILNQRLRDPFRMDHTWRVRQALDVERMHAASQHLLGSHDFSSFCRRLFVDDVADEPLEKSRIRRMKSIEWTAEANNEVHLNITANAFCQQMVRSITGLLVDVGMGELAPIQILPTDVPDILAAKDRTRVPRIAPPHGLYLLSVTY